SAMRGSKPSARMQNSCGRSRSRYGASNGQLTKTFVANGNRRSLLVRSVVADHPVAAVHEHVGAVLARQFLAVGLGLLLAREVLGRADRALPAHAPAARRAGNDMPRIL